MSHVIPLSTVFPRPYARLKEWLIAPKEEMFTIRPASPRDQQARRIDGGDEVTTQTDVVHPFPLLGVGLQEAPVGEFRHVVNAGVDVVYDEVAPARLLLDSREELPDLLLLPLTRAHAYPAAAERLHLAGHILDRARLGSVPAAYRPAGQVDGRPSLAEPLRDPPLDPRFPPVTSATCPASGALRESAYMNGRMEPTGIRCHSWKM